MTPWPPCVHSQHVPVCTFNASPCVPAPRVHVSTHVRVVPAYTGTFWMYTRERFWTHTRVFPLFFSVPHHTQTHTNTHTHTKHTTTTEQHHDRNDTHHTTQHTTSHGDRERKRERQRETEKERDKIQDKTREDRKKRREKTRRENEQDKRRDEVKKKREDEREKKRHDEKEERRWQRKCKEIEVIFPKNVSRPSNPPDELAQNVSKNNPRRTNYSSIFLRKFRIWPCFQLFTWFEFDFSDRVN